MRRFALPIAFLLVALLPHPAWAADGDALTITAGGSGLSVVVTDATTLGNFTRAIAVQRDWEPFSEQLNFKTTHVISLRVTTVQGSVTTTQYSLFYYSAEVSGDHGGALINENRTSYLLDSTVNGLLRPHLERLQVLEGEVALARTLQIVAGVALALLVGALFFIGMREERKPEVLP